MTEGNREHCSNYEPSYTDLNRSTHRKSLKILYHISLFLKIWTDIKTFQKKTKIYSLQEAMITFIDEPWHKTSWPFRSSRKDGFPLLHNGSTCSTMRSPPRATFLSYGLRPYEPTPPQFSRELDKSSEVEKALDLYYTET